MFTSDPVFDENTAVLIIRNSDQVIRWQNMARKGRELEKLTALFEEQLADSDIKVKSPDFIEDKTTYNKREIDISLTGTFGSHKMLVIVECRDRKNTEDVTWIEQLATKRDDVGANKAVAVSSSGFSEGACKKALSKDIELRTFEEIEVEEIKKWFLPDKLTHCIIRYELLQATIIPDRTIKESELEVLHQFTRPFSEGGFKTDLAFLHDPSYEHLMSIDDFVKGNSDEIFKDVKFDNEETEVEIRLASKKTETGLYCETSNGRVKIQSVVAKLKIWREIGESKIASVSSYKSETDSFGQVISFEDFEVDGHKTSLQMYRIPQGNKQIIGIRVKNHDEQ